MRTHKRLIDIHNPNPRTVDAMMKLDFLPASRSKSSLTTNAGGYDIMKKAIVGKKIGMTQVFTDDGRLVPVTVVEAGPCKVVQKKTIESDGYEAVQVGFAH